MKLRGDFIEAISRLYVEKHKPQQYKKLIDKEQQDETFTWSFTKIALHNKSFYDLINKQEGFLALQSYFLKATLLLDRDAIAFPQSSVNGDQIPLLYQQLSSYPGNGQNRYTANTNCYSNFCFEVDEFKFFKIIQNVVEYQKSASNEVDLEDEIIQKDTVSDQDDNNHSYADANQLDWLASTELYDILDSCGFESVGFREFCAFVLIVAAIPSAQLTKCLYDHCALLFDIVAAGQINISGERMKLLGRIISINEDIMQNICDQFDVGFTTIVSYEDFQMYYFEVFQQVDSIIQDQLMEQQQLKQLQEDNQQYNQNETDENQIELVNNKTTKTKNNAQYNQLVQDSIKLEDHNHNKIEDSVNQIDSSSFLFEKINNSKDNEKLIEKLKKPKPRKLEPLMNENNQQPLQTKKKAVDKNKTRDSILNQNINEEDEEGNESERYRGGASNTAFIQSSTVRGDAYNNSRESNNERASIVKTGLQTELKKSKQNAFCCRPGACSIF
ncbi:UNKNOWN [Stylonychia lemnae]|uniref:Uncharacterized protein n=1 Tax=Stylonychia lemnae TaxID=5949 RepID=A0A077ZTL8_STYLE|nr:UNKNOWN [Stylonychia lemnae]|eukprot:CDW73237.1 UNKNOWN [Stylonychia lemnae]